MNVARRVHCMSIINSAFVTLWPDPDLNAILSPMCLRTDANTSTHDRMYGATQATAYLSHTQPITKNAPCKFQHVIRRIQTSHFLICFLFLGAIFAERYSSLPVLREGQRNILITTVMIVKLQTTCSNTDE